MKKLAINVGSSSLKWTLFGKDNDPLDTDNVKFSEKPNNVEAYKEVAKQLLGNAKLEVANSDYVVHRVVHGGEEFIKPTKVSDVFLKRLEFYDALAPLHNPGQRMFIQAIRELEPNLPQFMIFDTAYANSMPREEYLYGIPLKYHEELKVRQYGFHGIAHAFANREAEKLISKDSRRHISLQLGSGSSVCAIENGKVIANSFGFSPTENLIMATRAGEVDYDAVQYIKNKENMTDSEVSHMLNYKSGLLALSGYTNDMKVLLEDYNSNERAKLAIDMYVGAIVDYIAAYFVKLGGLDLLSFSGGVGEGSDVIRKMIVSKLAPLGVELDETKNSGQIDVREILNLTTGKSKADIYVIPADEMLEMVLEVGEQIKVNTL